MLTAAKLHAVLDGLDPEARVVVGIMNGPRFNAAYAEQQVCGGALAAYLCCYEEALPWEGPVPVPTGEGTATLRYEPPEAAGSAPDDPVDLELSRYRAQADQLASTLRDALLEMDRGDLAVVIRACGKGDLSGLDEKALGMVGFLALVGFFGLFEPGEG